MFTFFAKKTHEREQIPKNATLEKILPLRRVASAYGELTRLFYSFWGFKDKKSLALKPESAGLVESAAPSASRVIFLNLC